jgi:hypothetical protein
LACTSPLTFSKSNNSRQPATVHSDLVAQGLSLSRKKEYTKRTNPIYRRVEQSTRTGCRGRKSPSRKIYPRRASLNTHFPPALQNHEYCHRNGTVAGTPRQTVVCRYRTFSIFKLPTCTAHICFGDSESVCTTNRKWESEVCIGLKGFSKPVRSGLQFSRCTRRVRG